MEFVDVGELATSPLYIYVRRPFFFAEGGKTELLDGESAFAVLYVCVMTIQKEIVRRQNVSPSLSPVKKLMTFNSVTKLRAILNAVSKNVKTDLPIGRDGPNMVLPGNTLSQTFIEERIKLTKHGDKIHTLMQRMKCYLRQFDS